MKPLTFKNYCMFICGLLKTQIQNVFGVNYAAFPAFFFIIKRISMKNSMNYLLNIGFK